MSKHIVATRPQSVDDTRHEGIQQALDVLHSRKSALNAMFNDAASRHDSEAMNALTIRLDEVRGTITAIRARVGS